MDFDIVEGKIARGNPLSGWLVFGNHLVIEKLRVIINFYGASDHMGYLYLKFILKHIKAKYLFWKKKFLAQGFICAIWRFHKSTPWHPLKAITFNIVHYSLLTYHNYHFSLIGNLIFDTSEISWARLTYIDIQYIVILNPLFIVAKSPF